jgi:hypothetical protein
VASRAEGPLRPGIFAVPQIRLIDEPSLNERLTADSALLGHISDPTNPAALSLAI